MAVNRLPWQPRRFLDDILHRTPSVVNQEAGPSTSHGGDNGEDNRWQQDRRAESNRWQQNRPRLRATTTRRRIGKFLLCQALLCFVVLGLDLALQLTSVNMSNTRVQKLSEVFCSLITLAAILLFILSISLMW